MEIVGPNKIIAVLRANDAKAYAPVLEVLIEEGITALELTLTTPNTLDELPAILNRFGFGATIGVGTVLTETDAKIAIDEGANFLVAPNLNEAVVEMAVLRNVPMFPGVMTPSEVQRAIELGAPAVKIFPAQTVGAKFLKHLKGPYPTISAIPSGGIDLGQAKEWLAVGAAAVSVGGPLLGDVFVTRDFDGLRKRARGFVTALADT